MWGKPGCFHSHFLVWRLRRRPLSISHSPVVHALTKVLRLSVRVWALEKNKHQFGTFFKSAGNRTSFLCHPAIGYNLTWISIFNALAALPPRIWWSFGFGMLCDRCPARLLAWPGRLNPEVLRTSRLCPTCHLDLAMIYHKTWFIPHEAGSSNWLFPVLRGMLGLFNATVPVRIPCRKGRKTNRSAVQRQPSLSCLPC